MNKDNIQFNPGKTLEYLKPGKPMHGEAGFLTLLTKQLTEAVLQAVQKQHLVSAAGKNNRNRCARNTVKSPSVRKLTETKRGFVNENSLIKLLYAGILTAPGKWTHPGQNKNLKLSQRAVDLEGRSDIVSGNLRTI